VPNELNAKLIVTDTGPLITLAAADSLAYLLYPDAPVYIPDAVLYEATTKSSALGASSIAAWVQEHPDRVFPVVTETYANFLAAREASPRHRERDLGERAVGLPDVAELSRPVGRRDAGLVVDLVRAQARLPLVREGAREALPRALDLVGREPALDHEEAVAPVALDLLLARGVHGVHSII
jgi:hypothetical protein